jgi:hypothetical protein
MTAFKELERLQLDRVNIERAALDLAPLAGAGQTGETL